VFTDEEYQEIAKIPGETDNRIWRGWFLIWLIVIVACFIVVAH
jgi:hypothetical protein